MIEKPCPGFPDPWDLMFRSENEAFRPPVMDISPDHPLLVSNSSKLIEQSVQFDAVKCYHHPGGFAGRSFSPASGPSEQDGNLCIESFFEDFITSYNINTDAGYLSFLPGMYGTVASSSSLHLAVRAAAFAYRGNKMQVRQGEVRAQELYGRALRALKTDLESPGIATSNVTLTAVLILGLYEVRMQTNVDMSFALMDVCSTLLATTITSTGIRMEKACAH